MKLTLLTKAAVKPLVLAAIGLITLMNVAKAGGDSYTIYLNGKQMMKQYVTQPLSLASLPVNDLKATDVLVVYYSHCGTIGKDRSISVKDEHGTVLRQWKFADVAGKDNGMQIPVKELQELQKKNAHISLYYASQQLPAGRMLTGLGGRTGVTASLWLPHFGLNMGK